MMFRCGPSWQERSERLTHWHRWFAWRPVRVERVCIWLEYVERRGFYHGSEDGHWTWSYRSYHKEE